MKSNINKLLARLLCKIIGHKGPENTTYSVKRTVTNIAAIKWQCPRCGESESAVMLGQQKDGAIIDNATFETQQPLSTPKKQLK